MIEEHDGLIVRCPSLGGEVPFRYCRTLQGDLPGPRMTVCWEFRMEISRFLSEHYSADQIRRAWPLPTRTRLKTILDLIEAAEKMKEENQK